MWMDEAGGSVVLTGSGKMNLSAWTPYQSGTAAGGLVAADTFVHAGPPLGLLDLYDSPLNFSGPSTIGPGTTGTLASSGSGDSFGIRFASPPRLALGALRQVGSSTWLGHSLASLGVSPGSYFWSWGTGASADSITLFVRGGACVDADGDGYGTVGHADCPGGLLADCNDADPLVHPSAADVCDGVDNDCQGGADTGDVCSAALVDGTIVTLEVEVLQGVEKTPFASIPFPVVLGGPDGTTTVGQLQLDIDVENDSIDVVVTNLGGGLGNVSILARLTGLAWTDPSTQIVAASVTGDYDYVAAENPPVFPLPGAAGIVDAGHGVQVYLDEALLQFSEVHSSSVRFAAQSVAPAVPALSLPAAGLLALALGGAGGARLRRRR
jgi:hypothetical protein